jgi:hypothetical protein
VRISVAVELGIPGLSLEVGAHVCAFFRGSQERDAILLSYLGAGLMSGDKCVCMLDSRRATPAT